MILLLPVLLVAHLLLLSKLTFTAWPEMLSYPYLFSNGFTLYKDYIMPYPPALIWLLSFLFNIFGFSPEVLKIATWAFILCVDILLYVILKKITKNNFISFIFLGVFIIFQSFLDGNMLWFDFAMVFPLLLAFNFALNRNLFLVGLSFGLAILIKQTAGIYLLGYLSFLGILGINKIKNIFRCLLGLAVMLISLLAYLILNQSLIHFWNWSFLYPLTEWSKFPGYVSFAITPKYFLVTLLLLSPLMGIFFSPRKLLKDKIIILSLIFLSAALIAVYPRFSFFHLQPAVAFTIILVARIFSIIPKDFKIIYLSGVFINCLLTVALLYQSGVGGEIRFYNDYDKKLAQAILENTKAGEKIYLLGLNSSQYVFTNRLPSENWSDNFGWYLEIPGVQEWTIEGLRKNPPEKVFWRTPSSGKWYDLGTYQPKKITEYIRQNYVLTDKIEGGIQVWTKKD